MGAILGSCFACDSGYFLQPNGAGTCLSNCPSGYSPNKGECIGENTIVFDAILDQIGDSMKAVTGQTLICGDTEEPELSDPLPSHHRGSYFSGHAYLRLPPAAQGSPLILPSTFTFSAWLRPQGTAQRTLYTKHSAPDRLLTISLNTANQITVKTSSTCTSFCDLSVALLDDQWSFIGLTFEYQASMDRALVRMYYDGEMGSFVYADRFRVTDIYTDMEQFVGVDWGFEDYYEGFIWRISFWNYLTTEFQLAISSKGCPADAPFCLSSRFFWQTSTNEPCLSSCTKGCVRPHDCGLCTDLLCEICTNIDTSECAHCVLNASVMHTCVCNQGYYAALSRRSCFRCDSSCLACSNTALPCTLCESGAVLDSSGKCVCSHSYYLSPTSSKCIPCPSNCNRCLTDICEICFPGYFAYQGKCLIHCPKGFSEDLNYWTCLSLPNPYTGIEVSGEVSETNNITVHFSQKVQPTLTLSELSFVLTDCDGVTHNLTLLGLEEVEANQTYTVSLRVTTEYLPGDNELVITFIHPEIFRDDYGNKLVNSVLTLTLHPINPADTLNNISSEPALASALGSSITLCIAIGLLSGSPSAFLALINTVQLLTYLPLTTIPLPAALKSKLMAINLLSFVPNPASQIAKCEGNESDVPQFARDYGFSTAAVLVNADVLIASLCLNMGCGLIVWLLSRVDRLHIRLKRVLTVYRWRNLMLHWFINYLDLSIFAFLQVYTVICKQFSCSSTYFCISSLLGVGISLLTFLLPFALLYLCIRHHSHITLEGLDLISAWRFLYQEFRNDRGWMSSAYHSFFILRRLIYALALVFVSRYPLAQAICCCIHSFAVNTTQTVIYLLAYRPFSDIIQLLTITSTEIAICLVFSIAITFNFDLSELYASIFTTTSTISLYLAICLPVAAGCCRLYIQLKALLIYFSKAKSRITPQLSRTIIAKQEICCDLNSALGPSIRPIAVYMQSVRPKE